MATSRNALKGYFKTLSTPTEGQFAELIDSAPNIKDDGLEKTASTPLKIQTGIDDPLQQVVAFYKSFADKDPSADWTIQLKAPGTNGASGLAIVKGGGTAPVLFIDEASGRININGTIKAGLDNASLKIEDSKILIKPGVIFEDQPITWLGGDEKFRKISDLPGNAAIFNEGSPDIDALMIVGRKRNLNNDKSQVVKIYNLLQVEGNLHVMGTDLVLGMGKTDRGDSGKSRAMVKFDGIGADGKPAPALVLNYNTDFKGGIRYYGTFGPTSSIKQKKNIEQLTFEEASEIFTNIKPVKFNYNNDSDDSPHRLGFIAEDTPPIISGTNHDMIDTHHLVTVLTMIVKKLSAEMGLLKTKGLLT